ncbi:MAG: aminotransferase class III-fold pyridoxal phosphate-dependent enzyme [Rhizobiales bacterium]|nr:aminotransferase class III-fold pyridoxal phosphate-dependent enzyme [Hyphomicrobiales bacterium]NRB15226.1 aminotransferase class III-fold pyridoxal phosphate-dependent enzyme [Hyphomicrobiales bacterium]
MANSFWADKVKKNWGIDANIQTLVGEYDLNFKITSGNNAYILKIMRPDCSPAFMDFQAEIFAHFNGSSAYLPEIIPSHDGQNFVKITDENDVERFAWLMTAFDGELYVNCKAKPLKLAKQFGENLAKLDLTLQNFEHQQLHKSLKWNLLEANWIKPQYKALYDGKRQDELAKIIADFEALLPQLNELPKQAIHNDLNDHNILVKKTTGGQQDLAGIIDFGDATFAPRVCNVAIAAAYLMLDVDRPLDYLQQFVSAYHQHNPLSAAEIRLIWQLARMRLAVSVVNSAVEKQARPDDAYVAVSQLAAWRLIDKSQNYAAEFVAARLLRACGLTYDGQAQRLNQWLLKNQNQFFPLFDQDLSDAPILDLSVAGADAPSNAKYPDMVELQTSIDDIAPAGKPSLGCYAEPRLVYASAAFFDGAHQAHQPHQASDRRTVHIAIDVFLPAGSVVYAPLDAIVHSASIQDADFDYGGLVTLKHKTDEGQEFYTLYGHLAWDEVKQLTPGQKIAKGEPFAKLGDYDENGRWPPHVHFQLGLYDWHGADWPGVVNPDDLAIWTSIFPDPAPMLNLNPGHATSLVPNQQRELSRRQAWSGANLSLTYAEPLLLQRGYECQMYDQWGRTYLDAFNNVPHVGHANPRIAKKAMRQMQMLNTNTRYLHQAQSDYAEAMLAKMPAHIDCIFFLNSASEANELAMRMAREYSGSQHTIVCAAGYHGNTLTAIDLSHYKFDSAGGHGAKDWVHVAPIPDGYRGEFKNSDPDAGLKYAQYTHDIIAKLQAKGEKLAAFITESFPSVGGQIIPPQGYLKAVFEYTRKAGGIAIADEVQTGMGRLGKYFWGFEQQDATPDMIILGKPIGNGHPIGILATSRNIANRFANGMEFFSTFGGSTLSCVIGLEVLKIVEEEKLQKNAELIGDYMLDAFKAMQSKIPAIGEVRGLGLFMGIEMIEPDGSPSQARADYILNRMAEQRILIGTDGPQHNILKLRAPLVFNQQDADHLLTNIEIIFAEQQDLIW